MSGPVDRARVIFQGTVQGVGFRYTTLRVAKGFPSLTGGVRNLADGTVELIVEGARAEIEALISAVSERMSGYIVHAHIEWGNIDRRSSAFTIRS